VRDVACASAIGGRSARTEHQTIEVKGGAAVITTFEYKGKTITLDRKDDRNADIVIENRVFPCMNHGDKFDMWMRPGAFYHPPELSSLGKHLVDYWYIITDPNTAPPSDDHDMPMPPHGGGGEHGGGGGGHGGHDVQQPVAQKRSAAKRAPGKTAATKKKTTAKRRTAKKSSKKASGR